MNYERLSVGVADLDASLRLWVDLLGFEVVACADAADAGLEALWELPPDAIVAQAVIATPDAPAGAVHLVQFAGETATVRADAAVTDRCPKNLDVNVVGLFDRVEELRAAGLRPRSEPVAYDIEGLHVREVQFPLADDVNLVLAEIVGEPLATTGRGFGGVTSVVTTSTDVPAETAFFEALGFVRLEQFELDGPSIEDMIGLPPGGGLKLQLLGDPDHRFGRAELIHYTGTAGADLYPRTVPPVRGLFRSQVRVDDLAAVDAQLAALEVEVGPVVEVEGPCTSGHLATAVSPAGWRVDLRQAR